MKLVSFGALMFSLIALALSSFALIKYKDKYRGYSSREELVREMTMTSSRWGQAVNG
jgi:hypothetical protein